MNAHMYTTNSNHKWLISPICVRNLGGPRGTFLAPGERVTFLFSQNDRCIGSVISRSEVRVTVMNCERVAWYVTQLT